MSRPPTICRVAIAKRRISRPSTVAGRRLCSWCKTSPLEGRRDRIFCSTLCRQASWRFGVKPSRRSYETSRRDPLQFAYADPPYPGKAGYYPEQKEVDHASLVDRLQQFDGWALSTSAAALREVLPSCPPGVRIGVWVRSLRPTRSAGPLNAWEPLIYRPLRPQATDKTQTVVDVLDYRGRYRAFPGALIGMKPPQFALWMFGLVAACPGDAFHDLYPGSGAVSLAWERFRDSSPPAGRDGSNKNGEP